MTLVYLVAGEASGDVLGGKLAAALAARRPDLRFAGVGGERMAAHGLHSLFPMQELALMGLLEVLPNLRRLRRRLAETVADIAAKRPDVVVTIDSPGFAFRLLKAIRPLGIRAPTTSRRRPGPGAKAACANSPVCGRPCSAFSRSSRHSSPGMAWMPPSSATRSLRAARTGVKQRGSARGTTFRPGQGS